MHPLIPAGWRGVILWLAAVTALPLVAADAPTRQRRLLIDHDGHLLFSTLTANYRADVDEEVRERGVNFSAGERQLISFARAVAFDPEILVLDEATASVDSASERLIQQGLEGLMEGRTTLVVAHRLSTIRDADRIVVIHRGEKAEEGSHAELMAAKGVYYRLYQLQFKD